MSGGTTEDIYLSRAGEAEMLDKLEEAARIDIAPDERAGVLESLGEMRFFLGMLDSAPEGGNGAETYRRSAGAEQERPAAQTAENADETGAAAGDPVPVKAYERLGIKDARKLLDSGTLTPDELEEICVGRITGTGADINAFLYLENAESRRKAREAAKTQAEPAPLAGIPCAVKDNICVADMPLTCGSAFLKDFMPGYDAEAAAGLRRAGARILGKTNLDEFAMGSTGECSAYGSVKNPLREGRMAGGSSSGSAAAVAAGMCAFALGSDTGGSVRLPASFCGITGLKPTYGRISRYGLTAFSSTTDCVGILAGSPGDASLVLEALAAKDLRVRDGSASKCGAAEEYSHAKEFDPDRRRFEGLKLAVPEKLLRTAGLPRDTEEVFGRALRILEELGFRLESVELGDARLQLAAYSVITSGEASSNLARFDGLRYGIRTGGRGVSGFGRDADAIGEAECGSGAEEIRDYDTFFRSNRGAGFGTEVKKRLIAGTYIMSVGRRIHAYTGAMDVRNAMIARRRELFGEFAGIVTPAALSGACRSGTLTSGMMHRQDLLTVGASLAGTPAVSVPMGLSEDGMPLGLQLEFPWSGEGLMLSAAEAFCREAGVL